MIALQNVTHTVQRGEERVPVLADASFEFDTRRMGLLAAREEQSEALVDLLAGYLLPNTGAMRRIGRVSWPLGRLAQFRSELSGRDTVRFLTQLYGLQLGLTEEFLHSLIDFGQHYDQPVSSWPRLLNVKFGHAAILLPEFDVYLVEGSIVLSDPEFMNAWRPLFEERLKSAQLIMSCNQVAYLSQFCKSVAVLRDGKLIRYSDTASAFQAVTLTATDANDTRPQNEIIDDKDDPLL